MRTKQNAKGLLILIPPVHKLIQYNNRVHLDDNKWKIAQDKELYMVPEGKRMQPYLGFTKIFRGRDQTPME
jgi:hypothetical protein